MRASPSLLLAAVVAAVAATSWPHEQGYHNHAKTGQFLRDLNKQFPHLVRVYSLGKSANMLNDMLVIELSAPPVDHGPPKRSVRLVGGVRGDQPVGRELLLNFAYLLATTYPKPDDVNATRPQLLDLLRIHILPTMNPDGAEVSREGVCSHGRGRNNINGAELDANFPRVNSTAPRNIQSETGAVIKWMSHVPSVLSLSFRGGAYVVGYPYETRKGKDNKSPNVAPDDDVLQYLAHQYADNNPKIKSSTLCNKKKFDGGVVNGAVWRNGEGGVQDYSYGTAGSMHLTVGMTCCNFPLRGNLTDIWLENKPALLGLMAAACGGINGMVRDATTMAPLSGARLSLNGRSDIAFYSNKMKGTFSRILLPGSYKLDVSMEGYRPVSQRFEITEDRTLYVDVQSFTVKVGYVEVLMPRAVSEPVHRENETTVVPAALVPRIDHGQYEHTTRSMLAPPVTSARSQRRETIEEISVRAAATRIRRSTMLFFVPLLIKYSTFLLCEMMLLIKL